VYEAHFGLTARPFAESADPAAFVALPSREAVIRRLRYGLEQARGPVLAFGPSGTGKTLLARKLARVLNRPVAHLTFTALPAEELLMLLADELFIPPAVGRDSKGMAATIQALRQTLRQRAVRGDRPLLIIDEAQAIADPGSFEVLRLLLNFSTDGEPDLSLVLIGGAELLMRMPGALRDRLAARCLLEPLDAAESSVYVEGRLSHAGARGTIFEAPAIERLHRAARGLPRQLNRIADMAMLVAFAGGCERVDAESVSIAEREAA
jgi:type II secretory pathway predicted ATPase ExeA